MNEQNKKDDTIIKNGVIQIGAESIVFAKGAFKACDDQQNFDSSANHQDYDLGLWEATRMYEPENLREAIETLIGYNTAALTTTRDGNGNECKTRIKDLQDRNLDVLYAVCDLLGMDDLFME